jgi:hypothetical protein
MKLWETGFCFRCKIKISSSHQKISIFKEIHFPPCPVFGKLSPFLPRDTSVSDPKISLLNRIPISYFCFRTHFLEIIFTVFVSNLLLEYISSVSKKNPHKKTRQTFLKNFVSLFYFERSRLRAPLPSFLFTLYAQKSLLSK